MIAVGVLSHWILDAISHRPDMPLVPRGDLYIGLGLWNSPVATVIVETALFVAGIWLYAAGTQSRDRIGSIGLWTYVGALAALYIANVVGPLPPSVRAVAVAGLGGFVFVLWAWWFNRHRNSAR